MIVRILFPLFNRGFRLMAIGFIVSSAGVTAQTTGGKQPLQHTEEVAVLTRYEVKQDSSETLRRMLHRYVAQAGARESNIMAEAYYEQERPEVLWVIERWSSKAALEQIKSSAAFREEKALLEKQLVQPARVIYVKDLEPLTRKEWRRAPAKEDKPITIMLFVDSKPGTEAQFKAVYHTAMPQFRSEPGVVNYQLSQLEEDSTQFVTYEQFRNEEAFQYHLNFPPIQPVIDYLNTSIKKPPFQAGLHRLIAFSTIKR